MLVRITVKIYIKMTAVLLYSHIYTDQKFNYRALTSEVTLRLLLLVAKRCYLAIKCALAHEFS